MRKTLYFLLLGIIPRLVTAGELKPFKFTADSLTHEGDIYLPSNFDCSQEDYWVLFDWHGWSLDPNDQNTRMNFLQFSDQLRGVVIAPSDEPCPENDSWVGCSSETMNTVVHWFLDRYSCLDSERIFHSGYSAGGQAVYRYTSDYPNLVSGIAVLAANGFYASSVPSKPIPIIHLHGDKDGDRL